MRGQYLRKRLLENCFHPVLLRRSATFRLKAVWIIESGSLPQATDYLAKISSLRQGYGSPPPRTLGFNHLRLLKAQPPPFALAPVDLPIRGADRFPFGLLTGFKLILWGKTQNHLKTWFILLLNHGRFTTYVTAHPLSLLYLTPRLNRQAARKPTVTLLRSNKK